MDTKNNPIERDSDLLVDSKKNQGIIKTEVKKKQRKKNVYIISLYIISL